MNMRVGLINTGSELLLGDRLNTHVQWLGLKLRELGLTLEWQIAVPDGDWLRSFLNDALSRCEILLITGGLGPTQDDTTREYVSECFQAPLYIHEGVLHDLKSWFERRGKIMADSNVRQAMVPQGAEVLPNACGTAPGLYLSSEKTRGHEVFLLPGPPRELYPMYEEEVVPRLQKKLRESGFLKEGEEALVTHYWKTTGLGESDLAARIQAPLENLGFAEVGYCLGNGDVDVRLTGTRARMEAAKALMRDLIGELIVSEDGSLLEQVVVKELAEARKTVTTAESCTGGLVSTRLTEVPGSSLVFRQSWVTYSNEAKAKELGVSKSDLETHGAVSEEVVRAMAEGALERAQADYALALSGIAGPGGGSPEKPVGTVWIALAEKNSATWARRFEFSFGRDRCRLMASQMALDAIRRRLRSLPDL